MRPAAAVARLAAAGGLALGVLGGPVLPAAADGWGGIVPGESTARDVRARFGDPTRERPVVEEGRTAAEWIYFGDRAPPGLERMVVGFGLLGPTGFTPDVVRALAIYPKPRVFSLAAVTTGWGPPDAVGSDQQTGQVALRYDRRGVLILIDRTESWAEMILFAPAR
jgi:hypothetical protein